MLLSLPIVTYCKHTHIYTHEHMTYIQYKGATDYTLRSYTGLGHSLNQEEINHAMAFLVQQLPFAADLAIPVKDPSEMSVKELKTAINNAGLQRQAVGLCEKSEFVKLIVEHRHQQSS